MHWLHNSHEAVEYKPYRLAPETTFHIFVQIGKVYAWIFRLDQLLQLGEFESSLIIDNLPE